ncbi:IS1634 family transposase [Methanosarcinales archaeon]|nr:MAG: IS1634 family transposase [Methanosarcinales archaeon]
MYIIKTISKSKKDSTQNYYTYRLMESTRVGTKVKKKTILNLGSDFSIEQALWATLTTRIDEIVKQRPSLFEVDKDLEEIAQQYALKIIASQATVKETTINDENRYKEIDTATIKNSDIKDIGIENILYKTIKELKLDSKLKELGFTNIQYNSALGTIIAKIANPSSEAKVYDWLCNTSGINELIGCDYNKISSNSIYRISDKLLANKDGLEEHLYTTQKEIFNYDETITLYDLTNTYFEGGAEGVEKAKRGRSKEKRSDAKIITLAVMLDSSGFVRKSEIFDGNISESATFKEMLDKLKVPKKEKNILNSHKSLVIMDAGIASQDNIDYLISNDYEYLVVSRKRNKQFDESKSIPVKLDKDNNAIVRAMKVVNEETSEVELFIHSKPREAKEEAMQKRVQTLFIEKLQHLKDGLSLKRRTKDYKKIIETIGRLKEKYPLISQYYSTIVIKDPNGDNAIDITWNEKKTLENKSAINGIYCLRTNNQTMDEKTLWKTYTTLTDLESVFKSLKSELGLRPIFHQTQTRVDGHLFITLLAYSIVHTIRYKLKQKDIHYSWDTIKEILRNQKRITTSMKCKDNTTLYIRQSSELNEKQKEIYDALEIKYRAGDVTKTFIE